MIEQRDKDGEEENMAVKETVNGFGGGGNFGVGSSGELKNNIGQNGGESIVSSSLFGAPHRYKSSLFGAPTSH